MKRYLNHYITFVAIISLLITGGCVNNTDEETDHSDRSAESITPTLGSDVSQAENLILADTEGRLSGVVDGVELEAIILDNSTEDIVPSYRCSNNEEVYIGDRLIPSDWVYSHTDDSGPCHYLKDDEEYEVLPGKYLFAYENGMPYNIPFFMAIGDQQAENVHDILTSVNYADFSSNYCNEELAELGMSADDSILDYDISCDNSSIDGDSSLREYTDMLFIRQSINGLPILSTSFIPPDGALLYEDIQGISLSVVSVFFANDQESYCAYAGGFRANDYEEIQRGRITDPSDWIEGVIPQIKSKLALRGISDLRVYYLELGYLNIAESDAYEEFDSDPTTSDTSYIVPAWCIGVINNADTGELTYNTIYYVNAYTGELMTR